MAQVGVILVTEVLVQLREVSGKKKIQAENKRKEKEVLIVDNFFFLRTDKMLLKNQIRN